MKAIILCGLSLIAIVLGSCKEPVRLDYSKLDTTFFVGEYRTNYKNEIETITLKENGSYDYAHGKNNDVFIKDAGKWWFDKEGFFVYLMDVPNIRKNKVYEMKEGKIIDLMLHIDNVYDLGDLFAEDLQERRYTFVKLNKGKNKYYLKNNP